MLDENNIYNNNYRIESYLCDQYDRLSMWGLSRLLQSVAEEHTILTHVSYYDLIKQDKAWVLSRMYYQVDSMPAYTDTVTLSTWSRGIDGLFNARDFLVTTDDGTRLAAATAYWVVIDFNSRHVARLHDIMDGYHHHPVCATNKEKLTKIRILPMDETCSVERFDVKPSMFDHTRHVNNSEYVRWIDDNLPDGMQMKTLEISYIAETRKNETINVLRNQLQDGVLQFQLFNNRGLSATAQVTTCSR